jgi:hypothetical protein
MHQTQMHQTMTVAESLTVSERFARSLLAAWNSGDLPRLRQELKQVASADHSGMSAFEHEKFEIVQGVAQTMRVWLGGAKRKHADLNIALTLLRHLIGQEPDQTIN